MLKQDEETADITDNGERVTHLLPNDCYYAHLSLYRFALRWARGQRVLDAGSGSGYGSAYLAEYGAKGVMGWEVSPKAVEFSRRHFQRHNLRYETVDLDHIGDAAGGPFDVVYSSNVLEHLTDVPAFLSRCVGLMANEGVGIFAVPPITSPELRHANLTNFYHLNIWTPRQWRHVLQHYFEEVDAYRHVPAIPADGRRLDLSNGAGLAQVSEQDFDFPPADPASDGDDSPTMTSVFVARRPRRSRRGRGSRVDRPDPLFIDDSFSREPVGAAVELGPLGARTDIVESSMETVGPIGPGIKFRQKFVARHDRLLGISLWVATYCRVVRSTLRLTVTDDSMKPLREVLAQTASFVDNEWQTFLFEPIPACRGNQYYFCVETDAAPDAVTCWMDGRLAGVLEKNGEPVGGAICFRSYYQDFPLR